MKDSKKIRDLDISFSGRNSFLPNVLKDALDDAAKQLGVNLEQPKPKNDVKQDYKTVTDPDAFTAGPDISFEKNSMLLDTYRIESDPINGGMGSVWKVHHTGWDIDLAMKRPQPKMFADEVSKDKFIAECQHWIDLGLHPNIVSCYYVRDIGGVPTIFSEWMDNGSLKDRIRDQSLYYGSDLDVQKRLLDIAIQYARGLRYAHSAGLIHQDVKPDNLLLTKDWQAKAADFGLANARAILTVLDGNITVEDSDQTMCAAAGGYTPAYCSMEQMGGKQLTRRTDIYSWAVSVMEMYLGSRPWQNGVVAGAACQEYMMKCRIEMPKSLQILLAKCMEGDPDDRPHDFEIIETELLKIYADLTGEDYPRPVPEASADNAESLNNRAVSFLDIGKESDAIELLKEGMTKRHFDSTLNLILYRWRTAEYSDQDVMRELDDLVKIYPDRSADLEQIRQQVLIEACGSPEPPRYRTIMPSGFLGSTLSNLILHDGKVIAVVRKRWKDGHVYNYVCHFETDTGRLLAQYPSDEDQPGIRFSGWEGSAGLSWDGKLLSITSSIKEHEGIFDVVSQKRVSEDPYRFKEMGKWRISTISADDFFKDKNQISSTYQDEIPLIGKKKDGNSVYEISSVETGQSVIRVVAHRLSWIFGSEFLVRTKTETFSILDASKKAVRILVKRGRLNGKTVLKSEKGNLTIIPDYDWSHGEVSQYAYGKFMVRLYGRYFALPDLREIEFPAQKDRSGHIYPRKIHSTSENQMLMREMINDRILLTLPLPVLPYDSSILSNEIQDYDGGRVIFFKSGSKTGWALLDLPAFPSEMYPQMKYHISVPVSSDEAMRRKKTEEERISLFLRSKEAGNIQDMIDIYRKTVSEESVGFETLHRMNEELSACCTKRNLLKVIGAPMNRFTAREEAVSLQLLPPRSCVSYSGRSYVFGDNYMIRRAEYPSGRVTYERKADALNSGFHYAHLESLCFGYKEEVYAAFYCYGHGGKKENRYRILGLGYDLTEKVILGEGQSEGVHVQLISVTEDNRFLLLSLTGDENRIILLDIQKKEIIRDLVINNNAKDAGSFQVNESLSMLCNNNTALELLWDYDPAPIERILPDVMPNTTMRISDKCLEEYYGEEGVDSVEIPEGITAIGEGAFEGCTLIRSVVIPEGVEYIGDRAFKNCTKLQKVDIRSHKLKGMFRDAFSNCSELSDFRMVESQLRVISDGTFAGCKKLEKMSIPEGIWKIGDNAFELSGLVECKLPSTLRVIGKEAFFHSYIRDIVLPEGLETLGEGAFDSTLLTSVTIPSSIDTLPAELFCQCRNLKHIYNDGSIKQIGQGALRDCSGLKSVQVAYGAVLNTNMFAEPPSFTKRAYKNAKKKTIIEPTRIHGVTWDIIHGKYVHMCYIEFIPVSK